MQAVVCCVLLSAVWLVCLHATIRSMSARYYLVTKKTHEAVRTWCRLCTVLSTWQLANRPFCLLDEQLIAVVGLVQGAS